MRNTLLLRIGENNATINSNYRMALVVCAKMVIRYDRVYFTELIRPVFMLK